ncbi:MAG TPA: hypothetical protein VHY58_16430 [Streptosporangiaceae bacterium]|jgi:hypothetical protein|nr:hypothetical protein [Streptosporangiaceae bacterium]
METVIGFVVGYLVGANDGKGGVERLKASITAIVSSPEAHRLIGEAMSVAEPVVRQASRVGLSSMSGGLGGVGGTVVRQIINRAAGVREDSRAA